MLSHWEKTRMLDYDDAVVGGGITGVSTAIELKRSRPDRSVLLLERGLLPSGASTRNAGFACVGSLGEICADLSRMPVEQLLEIVDLRRAGLQILRERLGDERLGFRKHGSYEWLQPHETGLLDRMDEINSLLKPIFGTDIYTDQSARIGEFGFEGGFVRGMIGNAAEGQLHPGQMMRELWKLAADCGVELRTGSELLDFESQADGYQLNCRGADDRLLPFRTERLFVCTNAFSRQLLGDLNLKPGRGMVLSTKPVEGLPFRGIFHFERGFYYFRNHGKRVIFGGGRQLDMEGETTTEFGLSERIETDLTEKLANLILPGLRFSIEDKWSGIMAFSENGLPLLKALNERLFIACRLNGMGVAIGSALARKLVGMANRGD